jgi:hypothetical protein
VWRSEDGSEEVVVGSVEELHRLSGVRVTDLHRHFVDEITIPSARNPGGPPLRRCEDVFDCWFESGSMPYASVHYPFERAAQFEGNFPADFVAEGLDQTRGWFYTLIVLSTALFDKPAFKNLVCNGLVLAADGKKMSKSLKNYPAPEGVIAEYGADALRLYLVNSPVVRAEPLRFQKEGVFSVVKDVLLKWYNAYRFLAQNARRASAEAGGAPFDPAAVMQLARRVRIVEAEMCVYEAEWPTAAACPTMKPRVAAVVAAKARRAVFPAVLVLGLAAAVVTQAARHRRTLRALARRVRAGDTGALRAVIGVLAAKVRELINMRYAIAVLTRCCARPARMRRRRRSARAATQARATRSDSRVTACHASDSLTRACHLSAES